MYRKVYNWLPMKRYFKELNVLSGKIEARIATKYPILATIFDSNYFDGIREQIQEMSKNDLQGPIHSMFVAMTRDNEQKRGFLPLFEKHLSLIFNHPSIKPSLISYTKKELISERCINTMFEVSTIGNLISKIGPDKTTLYAKTAGPKDVDIKIDLFDRPIYVEISVLGESRGDADLRDRMMRKKRGVYSGSRDMAHDTGRFKVKVEEKTKQFLPNKPNVLILCTFDFFPVELEIKQAMTNNYFVHVGILLRFYREKLKNTFTNLDKNCQLTGREMNWFRDFFESKEYKPLIY